MLDLRFSEGRPDATLLSEDENRTVAWMAPSGEIAALLIQDYANSESRSIPFRFGSIEVINDGREVVVFLTPRTTP
jgi:hypothetical protein